MHNGLFIILSYFMALIFSGCGGGDTTPSDTPVPTVMSKIFGTVPGTLIEAFCEDGTYAKVHSTPNGTNQHTFEIKVPQNRNCKLVMTTNENDPETRIITLIGFIKDTTSGTTISLTENIDLSYIALELDYNDINDTNGDHVRDELVNVLLPDNSGASINDTSVFDTNNNNRIDVYEDTNGDGIVSAYEDDDNDGTANIYDDDDNDNKPDYIEDDDNDGKINHKDDDNHNGTPDYLDDDDNDGKVNHLDNDDTNDDEDDDDYDDDRDN